MYMQLAEEKRGDTKRRRPEALTSVRVRLALRGCRFAVPRAAGRRAAQPGRAASTAAQRGRDSPQPEPRPLLASFVPKLKPGHSETETRGTSLQKAQLQFQVELK